MNNIVILFPGFAFIFSLKRKNMSHFENIFQYKNRIVQNDCFSKSK
jgi:hypothetical protein